MKLSNDDIDIGVWDAPTLQRTGINPACHKPFMAWVYSHPTGKHVGLLLFNFE